jgi:hypothetical protein
VDPESVNQIVKAIMSTHDGRTWKPETVAAVIAAVAATGAAIVTFTLGKRQMVSAQRIAQQQIDAAKDTAQRQIESAQAVAKLQIESAQEVARLTMIAPMREKWIGKLRDKIGELMSRCAIVFFNLEPVEQHNPRIAALRHEIALMLNPAEREHALLDGALADLVVAAGRAPPSTQEGANLYTQRETAVRQFARLILKSEWSKVAHDELLLKEAISKLTPEEIDRRTKAKQRER